MKMKLSDTITKIEITKTEYPDIQEGGWYVRSGTIVKTAWLSKDGKTLFVQYDPSVDPWQFIMDILAHEA